MKLKTSALVADMSGSCSDFTAASWKGILYIRERVIPHNPKTAAQTAVRDSLARCVPLWRSYPYWVKLFLDGYGTGYAMSGYNIFMHLCRALEQAAGKLIIVPPSPYCPKPGTFAAVTGVTDPGDIDLSWVDTSTTDYDFLHAFARKVGTNEFVDGGSDTSDAAALTIAGLEEDTDYDVYGFFRSADSLLIGTSDGVQAVTSKAGV